MLSKVRAYLTSPAFNTARAVLYVALPAYLTQLVVQGRLSQDHANLWTAVVVAALGPALASVFAPNGLRTYLFLLAGAVQALLVGLGGWSNNALGLLVIAVLGAFATSGVAAANVHSPAQNAPGA
jgi:Na+/H+ antiporter NhaB